MRLMKETQIEVVDPRYRVPRIKIPTVASVEKAGSLLTIPQACKTGEFRKEIATMVAEEGVRARKFHTPHGGLAGSPFL